MDPLAYRGTRAAALAAYGLLMAYGASGLLQPLAAPSPAVSAPLATTQSPAQASVSLVPSPATLDREAMRAVIMRHGLFPQPAEGTVEPGAIPDSAVPVVAAPPLDLLRKIKVTAIVYGIGRPSYAILEDLATQKQALYRVGDQVPGVGDVRRIERQAVVVGRGRQEGSVPFLRDAEPAVPPSQ